MSENLLITGLDDLRELSEPMVLAAFGLHLSQGSNEEQVFEVMMDSEPEASYTYIMMYYYEIQLWTMHTEAVYRLGIHRQCPSATGAKMGAKKIIFACCIKDTAGRDSELSAKARCAKAI